MRIEFDKMEGAGNDFVMIDNRRGQVPDAAKGGLVVEYCRRAQGIGADGMIFIEPDDEYDFSWDFYNSDGSKPGMCGNGARCAVRFAAKIGAAGEAMTFRTLAGPISGELTPRGAKVRLTDVSGITASEFINVGGKTMSVWFLNTGVPHVVVECPDLSAVDVRGLGGAIRHHERFGRAGANVNFIKTGDGDALAIRTYERGVEDETLACGTGTVAAGIVAAKFLGKASPVTAIARSGEELVAYFTLEGDAARDVFLEGGARLVFSGVLDC